MNSKDVAVFHYFVLLHNDETWTFKVRDISKLMLFDHSCLWSIFHISRDHWVSNAEVGRKISSKDDKLFNEATDLQRLGWLGYVLLILSHSLSWLAIQAEIGVCRRKAIVSEIKTLYQFMKSMNIGLLCTSRPRLFGWHLWDNSNLLEVGWSRFEIQNYFIFSYSLNPSLLFKIYSTMFNLSHYHWYYYYFSSFAIHLVNSISLGWCGTRTWTDVRVSCSMWIMIGWRILW